MTSKREEVIAKARAAIKSSDSIELVRAFECLAAEQSHTPTNDEREAPEAPIHYDSEQAFAWQSGWEAGLRDARRPVQGEPSDAQVISALNAWQDRKRLGTSLGDWGGFKVERMRAALRAAFAVGGGESE